MKGIFYLQLKISYSIEQSVFAVTMHGFENAICGLQRYPRRIRVNQIIGAVATTLAILMSLIGLPTQILINYKRKSTEGLSLIFYLIFLVNVCCWLLYGLTMEKIDFFLVAANLPAAFLIAMLIIQFVVYRRKSGSDR